MRWVGKSVPRVDAIPKVSGQSVYAADLQFENPLFIKVLRSPHPHALIRGIDDSAALRIDGVFRILTAADIPGENLSGKIKRDQPVLAREKVRYVGEPVAVVVARTEEIARRAVNKILVHYDVIAPVLTIEDALKPNGPIVHEGTNLLKDFRLRKGDIEKGFRECDVVVEETYSTPLVEHAYIEPDAGAARVDAAGTVWLYAATQNSHQISRELCRILGLPDERVRLIQTVVGGAFGGKIDLSVHGILALAALKTGKRVKWAYEREECFLSTTKRHPSIIRYRSGARRDGTLLAVDVDILFDTGAYASSGPAVATRAGIHALGPYSVPNVRVRSRAVYTNNPIAGAMRGFGIPQVAFAHESQMDILAERLGISPYRIRKINILRRGSITSTGQVLKRSVGIGATLEAARRKLQNQKRPKSVKSYIRRGIGYGCAFHGVGNTGVVNHAEVRIKLSHEGKITVFVGASELGQGLKTAFQQMTCEILAVPSAMCEVHTEDTRLTGDPDVTSASKQTYVTGNAIVRAARGLIHQVSTLAAKHFGVPRKQVAYSDGEWRVRRQGSVMSFSLLDLHSAIDGLPPEIEAIGKFSTSVTPLDPETGQGIPYPAYSYATQIAEVEIDTRTGKLKVVRFISATDVGRAINPTSVTGQIIGGVVMGIGYAAMEEYVPGITNGFKEYVVPTSCDVPVVVPIIIESAGSSGPFGAKGVGEVVVNPTAAAVANAVSNAIGIRFHQLPLTAERIYTELKGRTR